MSAQKIDQSVIRIGIDLGTTNSEIAVDTGSGVEVVKNLLGDDYTPSVFGVDKAGNKVVGKKAYNKLFRSSSSDEFANNKAEVKRLMGTNQTINFPRLHAKMTPEEVSAEILKSLKADLTRKCPSFPTTAAVITVPAYFDSLQNEATKRAGKLAGFKYVVLLQEPIAAAMAYGFGSDKNQSWIVYDLGGGTFDVALVSSNAGILKVVEHGGDNFLGGKDIDNKLVDDVIRPAILSSFNITDFTASNPKYSSTFAKLKAIAETAKIELSSYNKTTIEIDEVGSDDDGREIYLSLDYTRQEFDDLIRPIVDKTIDITKDVIKRSKISKSAISKIVFVGGPTQIPYIRKRAGDDLGIQIDTSVDPLTTVARGACVYGLSERIPENITESTSRLDSNTVKLTINYDPMTSDDEEMITGTASLPDNGEYSLKISSDSGFYTSNNIKIKNGKFFDTVAVEPSKTNTYWIYLVDKNGNSLPVSPESFTITQGLSVQGVPIPHDIGVIYAKKNFDNDFKMTEACDKFFERGSILPLEATKPYRTARDLKKNAENPLPIKVYEGDSSNPSYNSTITTLAIDGNKLDYDLPAGSDIDITIKINESREVTVEAYLPDLDLLVDARVDEYAQSINVNELRSGLARQKERADKISSDNKEKKTIEDQLKTIERNLDTNDTDSQQKAERDLRSLGQKLDSIEQSGLTGNLIGQLSRAITDVKSLVSEMPTDVNINRLTKECSRVENDAKKAIDSKDEVLLKRAIDQVTSLWFRVAQEHPGFWVDMLGRAIDRKPQMSDQRLADYHISKANEAIDKTDLEELKRHVRELWKLIPEDERDDAEFGNIAGITK